MKLEDLISACVAAPDDDEPRLWADAVGGELGELVDLTAAWTLMLADGHALWWERTTVTP